MDIPRVKDWQELQNMAAHRKSWRARVHKLKPPDCSTHFTAKIQQQPHSSPPTTTDSPGYKKFSRREKITQAKSRQARARRRAAQFDLDIEDPDPVTTTPKTTTMKCKTHKQYANDIEAAAALVFSSSDSETTTDSHEDNESHTNQDALQLKRVKRYITRDRHEMFFRPKQHRVNKQTSLWAAAAPSPPSSLWAAAAPTPPPTPTSTERTSWTPTTLDDSIEWNTPDIMGHHRQPQHHPREDITFRL